MQLRKGKVIHMYQYISGFSDEIASDIDTQFQVLNKLGISYFEPRGINGKNIAFLDDSEVAALKEKMHAYGIQVSSIGSPIGKIKLEEDFEPHYAQFQRVVAIAKELGTHFIRIFSFYHEGTNWSSEERAEVLRRLKRMIAYAEEQDVILLHENEKDIYGDIAERCQDLMQELYGPHFKAVFDPANFVQSGSDTLKAYNLMKDYIAYMHIKDAKTVDGSVMPAGMGDGHVAEILKQLSQKGYNGFFSLEPHLGSFEGLGELEQSDLMKNLPQGGEGTFTLAFRALSALLGSSFRPTEVRLGIIGFGNMGNTHAKNIYAGKVPGMKLAAICDTSEPRRKAVKQLYPDVPVFETAEEMYQSGLCNAVIIAVPHYDHPTLAIRAFDYDLNVITEKPAGVYTKQVKEMNEAAEKSGRLFGIMYNQRTRPVYQKLRSMIQRGELGHIKRITWIITDWYRPQAYHDSSTWRSTWATEGGGALINQNPHQLDLWQWLFGMPDRIFAKASFGKYYNIEVEDDVMAFMEYDNGTTGEYITSTGEAPGTNRLEIACDMGKVVIENNTLIFNRNVISEREHNKINTIPFGQPECWECKIPADFEGPEHVGIFRDFTKVMLHGGKLLAPGTEGIYGLTISNAIHLSAWTGETVDVKNFPDDRFYDLLQEKIRTSTIVKKDQQIIVDNSATY